MEEQPEQGFYRREYEHDACGVGMVADLNGIASHEIVTKSLTILKRLMHRGATGNDPETGDGAGLLMQIPDGFFRKVVPNLPEKGAYGIAMIFGAEGEEKACEEAVKGEGLEVIAWREVPHDPQAVGPVARSVCPRIRQLFLKRTSGTTRLGDAPVADAASVSRRWGSAETSGTTRLGDALVADAASISRRWGSAETSGTTRLGDAPVADAASVSRRWGSAETSGTTRLGDALVADFERKLYVARRSVEKQLKHGYVCSMSARTIVYKGLLLATQVEKFYPDLADSDFTSALTIVHQRYSTNTFPTWELAHPFRMLAHNGEINTLRGNLNALRMREKSLASPLFGEDIKKLLPLVPEGQSDSASLDNMFELLVAAGRDPAHAMLMLMPQAWGVRYHMGHDVRGFYEYHSALMEPWDGPAAVAFTDGVTAGAALDRNGLRPARWTLTKDGLFVLASEAGVLDIPPEQVVRHGRLRPGSMVYLDLPNHRVLEDAEIKNLYARRRPYRRWVDENRIAIQGLFTEIVPSKIDTDLRDRQRLFGYTDEDLELILAPMAKDGHEPVGSMGNDAPLAALSNRRRTLFDFFHQLFAQVTNPPIDPIREELVMSLMTYIGNKGNILEETPEHAHLIKLRRPVLTDDEIDRLEKVGDFGYKVTVLPMVLSDSLADSLRKLASDAVEAVRTGTKVLILSDKPSTSSFIPIPSLLATAAVNRALIAAGLRSSIGLVIQSGEVREVHHFAVLLGYGATAINPYLALGSVSALLPEDTVKAASNYINAVDKGLLKIMSKMGISTLRSYRSAQIFECVGLSKEVIDAFFPGTVSKVGGLKLADLEQRLRTAASSMPPDRHDEGQDQVEIAPLLDAGGLYRYRRNGEDHLWTPTSLANFRQAVRANDATKFKAYSDEINDLARHNVTLRSLFTFRKTTPIDLDEVEPAESVMRHFVGGAMSLGSLSPEAHEALARAFNSIGSMSNSGEGGENPERFGTDADCGIKQVASGRFGVTIDYLRHARDLQIKLAQGAKPGEGGQLPARKVNAFVGRLRHARPGTTLISPPPHHDIYSIEDLAQLIYDLRSANPKARISVKLVSEAGVGTIAAGVAKAHADVVLISGFDGGTGAAPLTSMKHAGLPWELGLAEAQQTLVKNNLRGRVKLQVDGQLKTGRDIVIGALLGAEEFGFGTTLLVALGCIQDRRCHCNTCPVGIATQEECLRRHFAGKPEHVVNFLRFLAEEVRQLLAQLGLRSLDEAVGRSDLLDQIPGTFEFKDLFYHAKAEDVPVRFTPGANPYVYDNYDRHELLPALEGLSPSAGHPSPVVIDRSIRNVNRTVGTELSGEVTSRWGLALPDDSVTVNFAGVAGQSFGAFLAKGITFNLRGEANDFVGKGLSGGHIAISPRLDSKNGSFVPEENVIAGNVIAYGATEGEIFINGLVGERFGIRNSGATLVAEGVGDHGCEYMTGGTAVILGPTGVNFGAGMTGGTAFVLDESGDFDLRCNLDSIDLCSVLPDTEGEKELLALLERHVALTHSPKAQRLLADWINVRPKFVQVVPVREI